MLNACFVFSKRFLIILKGYGVMLNSRVVLSPQSYYAKMLCYYTNNWFILSTKDVNFSIQCKLFYTTCYYVKYMYCFVQTVSYYVKMLCYYVKYTCCFVHTVSCCVKCHLSMFKNGL